MKLVIGGDISIKSPEAKILFSEKRTKEVFDKKLLDLFRSADEFIVNLECPITDSEIPIKKSGPALKAPFGTGDVLKEIGVTLCCLSNNHIFDYGKAGVIDTFEELNRCQLPYTGYGRNSLDARKNYFLEKDGIKIAVVNVCEHEYTYALPNREGAREYDPYDTTEDIIDAKNKADYVIVIYHGGKEHCEYPSPRLAKLCRSMVKFGADVVLCQHSHCIGVYEKFENGHILYGQGNFHFPFPKKTKEEQDKWDKGLAVVLNIDSTGLKFELVPLIVKGACLCIADSDEKILEKLEERSTIGDEGWYQGFKDFCSGANVYRYVFEGDDIQLKSHFIDCEAHLDVLKEIYKTYNWTNELD